MIIGISGKAQSGKDLIADIIQYLTMIKYIGPEDRQVPTQKERQEYAKKQKEQGEYKQWVI